MKSMLDDRCCNTCTHTPGNPCPDLLMCLTYYQCFNYSAKKRMKQAS